MANRNPFEPPSSRVEAEVRQLSSMAPPAVPNRKKALAVQAAIAVVVTWVALSPVLWWKSLSSRYGFQPQLEFMIQPIALAVIGLASLPFLFRQSAQAAVTLVLCAIAIAFSVFFHATALHDGALFNAGLLSVVGVVVLFRSARAKRDA